MSDLGTMLAISEMHTFAPCVATRITFLKNIHYETQNDRLTITTTNRIIITSSVIERTTAMLKKEQLLCVKKQWDEQKILVYFLSSVLNNRWGTNEKPLVIIM